jgi:hypothetical protein
MEYTRFKKVYFCGRVHDCHEIMAAEKVKNPSLSNSSGKEKVNICFTRVYETEREVLVS